MTKNSVDGQNLMRQLVCMNASRFRWRFLAAATNGHYNINFAQMVSGTAFKCISPRVCQLRVTFFGKFFGKPLPSLRSLNHSTGTSVSFNIINGLP
ncbi:MAG: hypothetical protein ACK56F_18365, partial [bacterium]